MFSSVPSRNPAQSVKEKWNFKICSLGCNDVENIDGFQFFPSCPAVKGADFCLFNLRTYWMVQEVQEGQQVQGVHGCRGDLQSHNLLRPDYPFHPLDQRFLENPAHHDLDLWKGDDWVAVKRESITLLLTLIYITHKDFLLKHFI